MTRAALCFLQSLGLSLPPDPLSCSPSQASFGDALQLWFLRDSMAMDDKAQLVDAAGHVDPRDCMAAVRQTLQYMAMETAGRNKVGGDGLFLWDCVLNPVPV